MAYSLEIKYYNSFWLKQVTTKKLVSNDDADFKIYGKIFPGLPFKKDGGGKWPDWPVSTGGYSPSVPYSNVNPINNVYSITNYEEGSKWVIEESRIRGGFNNTQVDPGVRAYLKEESNDVRYRQSSLVYSGIYNTRTNINNTNVFSIAEDITKTVDPHNGSIQHLFAMDNNLTIFQENKVSQALIDKDAIYSAEGTPLSTASNVVIGQVSPYVGDYGISRNPESFASFGFRRYFVDRDRNAVLRLSRDGITEISSYGMKDYFRDELAKVSDEIMVYSDSYPLVYNSSTGRIDQGPNDLGPNPIASPLGPWVSLGKVSAPEDITVGSQVQIQEDANSGRSNFVMTNSFVVGTGYYNNDFIVYLSLGSLPINGLGLNPRIRFVHFEKDKIEGGFDNYKDNYIVSLQRRSGSKTTDETSDYYSTLAFDESIQGWTTFYTYRPGMVLSMKNNMFTTKNGKLYKHYDNTVNTNNFYGVDNESSITFVFNNGPSLSKNFKTVSYEGSNGWEVDSFVSDVTGNILSNPDNEVRDTTLPVKSYDEGLYIENGIPYRVGFTRKDNKYVANLINNTAATTGEVNYGSSITGIKGFFAIVKMSTDATTNVGGTKELFAVSTEFAVSPR